MLSSPSRTKIVECVQGPGLRGEPPGTDAIHGEDLDHGPDNGLERGSAIVQLAVEDMGFDAANAELSISCDGGCFTVGATVKARVELRVELPLVAALPGINATAATVDATAAQKVGRFK